MFRKNIIINADYFKPARLIRKFSLVVEKDLENRDAKNTSLIFLPFLKIGFAIVKKVVQNLVQKRYNNELTCFDKQEVRQTDKEALIKNLKKWI